MWLFFGFSGFRKQTLSLLFFYTIVCKHIKYSSVQNKIPSNNAYSSLQKKTLVAVNVDKQSQHFQKQL